MVNLGRAASLGASGAISGGSIGGPWGAAIGGLVGGVTGLFGSGRKKKKRSAFDKRQKQLNEQQHDSILGKGPLADLYNYDPEEANSVFDQNIGNPAYRKFKEEIVPTITGQFRNQGLGQSSYAGDALARAGRDVQENLNAKRADYLYGEQKASRNAKQSAVENLQNRSTFAYDTAPNEGGFNIDEILRSITPEVISQTKNYFKPSAGVSNATGSNYRY